MRLESRRVLAVVVTHIQREPVGRLYPLVLIGSHFDESANFFVAADVACEDRLLAGLAPHDVHSV